MSENKRRPKCAPELTPESGTVLPFQKPSKRSAGWAVVRDDAPVMPWEGGEPMDPVIADVLHRVAAVSGTVLVARFYLDLLDLTDRLDQAQGIGPDLTKDEAEPIITGHYHELVDLHGREYGQRFLRIWLLVSNFVLAHDRRLAVRAALRKQVSRVSRR